MNASEVRERWPLGARFVARQDRTGRVRVVQAHVLPSVSGPDELMLAHDRSLYFPSQCEVPPPFELPGRVPPPLPPAERLQQALASTSTDTSNWQRLQQRIADEAEQTRQREQEAREQRAREAEERRREEVRRQREAIEERARQAREREERERAARQAARQAPQRQVREQPLADDPKLEAKVAELQRLLFAATEALAQIQQQISSPREMPMQSGKAEDEERRLLIDGEEQE